MARYIQIILICLVIMCWATVIAVDVKDLEDNIDFIFLASIISLIGVGIIQAIIEVGKKIDQINNKHGPK